MYCTRVPDSLAWASLAVFVPLKADVDTRFFPETVVNPIQLVSHVVMKVRSTAVAAGGDSLRQLQQCNGNRKLMRIASKIKELIAYLTTCPQQPVPTG